MRGTDADGRSVVQRQVAFPAGGKLVNVFVLQPTDPPDGAETDVQGLLDHLTVTAP